MKLILHEATKKFLPWHYLLIFYRLKKIFVVLFIVALGNSCQKKPALAPAGDPLSALEPPPMGATTYNDELKKELAILDDVLHNRVDSAQMLRVKNALKTGNLNDLSKASTSYESHLVKVLLTLPELVHGASDLSDLRKKWFVAKYYFLKRRFIEASMLMTDVVKAEPDFIEAQNWRARAIFFLGNPDLAITELSKIITKRGKESPEGLDALYLTGAMVFESNDNDQRRLLNGINAWTQYLARIDPDSELKKEVVDGLKELQQRKDGKENIAKINDPFQPQDSYSKQKNAVLTAFAKDQLLLALELVQKCLAQSYDQDLATIKARILFKKGRIEEAAELFSSIVTKDQNYAPGFHYQGMAFMLKGEPKNAVTAWSKTLAIDPQYANAHGLKQRIAIAQKMIGEENK